MYSQDASLYANTDLDHLLLTTDQIDSTSNAYWDAFFGPEFVGPYTFGTIWAHIFWGSMFAWQINLNSVLIGPNIFGTIIKVQYFSEGPKF